MTVPLFRNVGDDTKIFKQTNKQKNDLRENKVYNFVVHVQFFFFFFSRRTLKKKKKHQEKNKTSNFTPGVSAVVILAVGSQHSCAAPLAQLLQKLVHRTDVLC